jgi:hypothetical protein
VYVSWVNPPNSLSLVSVAGLLLHRATRSRFFWDVVLRHWVTGYLTFRDTIMVSSATIEMSPPPPRPFKHKNQTRTAPPDYILLKFFVVRTVRFGMKLYNDQRNAQVFN